MAPVPPCETSNAVLSFTGHPKVAVLIRPRRRAEAHGLAALLYMHHIGGRWDGEAVCRYCANRIGQREDKIITGIYRKAASADDGRCTAGERSGCRVAPSDLLHCQATGGGVAATKGRSAKCSLDAGVGAIDIIAGSGAVAAVAFNAVEIRRGIIIDRKRGGFGRRPASGVRYLGGDDHSAGGVEIVRGETGRGRTAYVWGRGDGVAFDRRAMRSQLRR